MCILRIANYIPAIMYSKLSVMQISLHPKLFVLIFSSCVFSILYMFLDDNHFSGVNFVKETIKQEVIKQKIHNEMKNLPATMTEMMSPMFGSTSYNIQETYTQFSKNKQTDAAIADATKSVTTEVKSEDLAAENINVSVFQRMFDRVYFSLNTSCLLGYGDIYPLSNIAKIITMIQALVTVSLIVF